MILGVGCNLQISTFKEGLALFDAFKGDTHFVPKPTSSIIEWLMGDPVDGLLLQARYIALCGLPESDGLEQFNQFVSEAIVIGIIEERWA